MSLSSPFFFGKKSRKYQPIYPLFKGGEKVFREYAYGIFKGFTTIFIISFKTVWFYVWRRQASSHKIIYGWTNER